jgi:uncharacterized membrane protein YGL010W
MHRFFCRQLAFYAQYHRDPRNCVTHYLGMPMLFVAAILPLQAARIAVDGYVLPLGILLTLPAIIGWIVLDLGVGVTLAFLLCPLLAISELVVRTGSSLLLWTSVTVLFVVGWSFQFLGHAVFERRRPAFADDLSQALIGPMFVVAKLLVRLGLRRDLAPYLAGEGQHALRHHG